MDNEIRIHYATHFLKLSLWYVKRIVNEEGILFEDAVNARVNIYRNTDFYDGKHQPAWGHKDRDWERYLEGLEAIVIQGQGEDSEEEGLAYLWPRVHKKYHRPSVKGRPYECWTFDDGEDYINIHIGNVYQPESPLSEKYEQFMGTLLQLLKDTQERRPEVTEVRCGSWMNSAPPFQHMFPKSWHESARVSPRSSWGMGHWGQFMDRTGRFHVQNGKKLRETGEFPYPSLGCRAPIGEIVGHLESVVRGQGSGIRDQGGVSES